MNPTVLYFSTLGWPVIKLTNPKLSPSFNCRTVESSLNYSFSMKTSIDPYSIKNIESLLSSSDEV